MKKAAWFFFFLAILGSGCGEKKTSPESESGDSSPPQASLKILPDPPNPAPKTDHLPGGFQESRLALEGFLAATGWKDRLNFVYAPDRLRDQIKSYYTSRPDGPIGEYNLKFLSMDETPQDGDYPLYVFTLHITNEDGEFPVTVRKTTDGMKVDWEIFTEFRDRKFKQFVESGTDGPETLRLILQRQSYWGEDREAMADLLSFRLMTMDPSLELFAFVPKDSKLLETMEEFYHWGVGPIAATVVIERQAFPHGKSHFVITRLGTHPKAGDGWHVR